MIKLIASDIDGTLLEDGGSRLNPELFEVILKLREKGIQFAAASGRQWVSIEKTFEPIKEKIFYVADNGAYVGCHGRNLFLTPLDSTMARSIIRDIQDIGLLAMAEGQDVAYFSEDSGDLFDWMVNNYKFHAVKVPDLLSVEDSIIKVSAYKPTGVEQAGSSLVEKYRGQVKVTVAGDMWLDFIALQVNKGEALKLLQESLEIKPEETMVFGDQLNDIEMIQRAYYSFAVGNARPEVRAAARFQTDINMRDGVLKILKLLL